MSSNFEDLMCTRNLSSEEGKLLLDPVPVAQQTYFNSLIKKTPFSSPEPKTSPHITMKPGFHRPAPKCPPVAFQREAIQKEKINKVRIYLVEEVTKEIGVAFL